MLTADTWLLLAPLLCAAGAGVVALVLDALGQVRLAVWGSALLLGIGAATALSLGASDASSYAVQRILEGTVEVGGWAANVTGIILALAAVILAGDSKRLVETDGGAVAALIALSAAGAVLLAAARDVGLFVLALETVAICGYALVASAHNSRSDEAAMKYFVQGAVVTGLLLYGSAVLFGVFGVGLGLGYDDLFISQAETSGPVLLVIVTFAAAVAFKMSAFPFHAWAPDALETAPAGPAAMLASVPKAAMLFAASILFGEVFAEHVQAWQPLFAGVAVASIAFGNLAALRQTSYQRMLAYSGIAQAGYALCGLIVFIEGTYRPFPVRLFALTYAVAVAGAFLAARAVRQSEPDWDGTIVGLGGLGSRRPVLAFSMAVCLFSLTGIPLTAGFMGKFWVFLGVVWAGWTWLAVVGFVGSVISFGYYGSVLRAMYLDDGGARGLPDDEAVDSSGTAVWAVSALALAVLLLGILPLLWGFVPLQEFLGV